MECAVCAGYALSSEDLPYGNGYIGSLYSINHILEGLYDKEENWVLEMVDNAGNTVAQKGTPHREATISYDKVLDYTNVGIRVTVGSARLYSSKGTGVLILMGAMLFAVLLILWFWGGRAEMYSNRWNCCGQQWKITAAEIWM